MVQAVHRSCRGAGLALGLLLALASCTRVGFDAARSGDGPVAGDGTPDLALLDLPRTEAAPTDLAAPDQPVVASGWVVVPPTSVPMPVVYVMGSPPGEPCRNAAREDGRNVALTRRFVLMDTEITQQAFNSLMGYNPAQTCSQADCPVSYVSWYEVVGYCNKLSESEGLETCYEVQSGSGKNTVYRIKPKYDGSGSATIYDCPGYRLPTDAEWELAYRAGGNGALYTSPGNDGSLSDCDSDPNADLIAWYSPTAGGNTQPVRGKAPNAWGLYDLAGNVWEWCNDLYVDRPAGGADPLGASTGTTRVLRGGGYGTGHYGASKLRAACRDVDRAPDYHFQYIGGRCARTLP